MNPLSWILLAFPVYLLIKGRIPDYINLAKSGESK